MAGPFGWTDRFREIRQHQVEGDADPKLVGFVRHDRMHQPRGKYCQSAGFDADVMYELVVFVLPMGARFDDMALHSRFNEGNDVGLVWDLYVVDPTEEVVRMGVWFVLRPGRVDRG